MINQKKINIVRIIDVFFVSLNLVLKNILFVELYFKKSFN
jgi:hypothetical protein